MVYVPLFALMLWSALHVLPPSVDHHNASHMLSALHAILIVVSVLLETLWETVGYGLFNLLHIMELAEAAFDGGKFLTYEPNLFELGC